MAAVPAPGHADALARYHAGRTRLERALRDVVRLRLRRLRAALTHLGVTP